MTSSYTGPQLSERDRRSGRQIRASEIRRRLGFLLNVGLDYLSLDRGARTLAGGEAQRIRLATQIGSGLTGVLYVLDEPSIGLHQRDNNRLLEHAAAAPGPGQHAHRRRARRGHDPRRRLGGRHRPRGGRARRPGGRVRAGHGAAGQREVADRGVPVRAGVDPVPQTRRSPSKSRVGGGQGGHRAQPAERRRRVPARLPGGRDRRVRFRASPPWSTRSCTARVAKELNGARTVPGSTPGSPG